MPVVSKAQNRFMRGCEHPESMQGKCPPPAVVQEFLARDVKVKDLPERAQRPHSSPPPTDAELAQGYRSLGKGDYS